MKTNKMFVHLFLFIAVMLISAGCSKVEFTPTDPNQSDQSAGDCGGSIATTHELTKMLFIVDMSGSNQSAPGCTISATCTDPNKTMRAGSIQKFFNDYAPKTNFQWAFNVFANGASSGLVNNGNPMNPIFSNPTAMQAGINMFQTIADQGTTPYMLGLTLATQAIQNDPDLHSKNNPQYIVVFMSDGQPDTTDTVPTILAQVSTMVNLLPGKVTFHGIYYGDGDATAAGIIQSMAQTGHGNFLNTFTNPKGLDFQISDLIRTPCN